MAWFKAAPLHRRRRGRRRGKNVRVLDETELCLVLGKPRTELTRELDRLEWPYHRDAAQQIWCTVPVEQVAELLNSLGEEGHAE